MAKAYDQHGGVPHDIETDHEYDGIREFDNPLPRWWLMTFYGAIVFSVGYWVYYHTLGTGDLPMEQLRIDVDEAERELMASGKGGFATREELAAIAADSAAVAEGKVQFDKHCASCHGVNGEGKVGPNLTDKFWLHGHTPVDNYTIIAKGFVKKGMPGWKRVLGETKVRQITGYVMTLRNTNLAGPLGEQGTPAPEPAPGPAPEPAPE